MKKELLLLLLMCICVLKGFSQSSTTTPEYSGNSDWKPEIIDDTPKKSSSSSSSSTPIPKVQWSYSGGSKSTSTSRSNSSYNNNSSNSAKRPFGRYVSRFIVEKNNGRMVYHSIYNPVTITSSGIEVKNTNKGTKTWAAKYQGPIRLTNTGGSERFHNFYLTNQHVEFNISDRPIHQYQGKSYYVIIFDGQIQLAEAVY
jgi:hypothetical protein